MLVPGETARFFGSGDQNGAGYDGLLESSVSTNQILTGLGLIIVLAVGSQILAGRLRVPAIIVLLPVGFAAGSLTSDVALASTMLQGSVDGPVYRLRPPRPDHGVVAPYTGGKTLFGAELTGPVVARRYLGGSIAARRGSDPSPEAVVLFVIRASGQLVPVTGDATPAYRDRDTTVLLGPPQPAAGPVPVPWHSTDQVTP
jgi:hypothetical protein